MPHRPTQVGEHAAKIAPGFTQTGRPRVIASRGRCQLLDALRYRQSPSQLACGKERLAEPPEIIDDRFHRDDAFVRGDGVVITTGSGEPPRISIEQIGMIRCQFGRAPGEGKGATIPPARLPFG